MGPLLDLQVPVKLLLHAGAAAVVGAAAPSFSISTSPVSTTQVGAGAEMRSEEACQHRGLFHAPRP